MISLAKHMIHFTAKLLKCIVGSNNYAGLAQFLWQDARNELPVDNGEKATRALLQVLLPASSAPATMLLCGDDSRFAADVIGLLPRSNQKHRIFYFEPDPEMRTARKDQLAGYASLAEIQPLVEEPAVDSFCQENLIDRIRLLHIAGGISTLSMLKNAKKLLDQKRIDFVCFDYGPEWIERREFLKDLLAAAQAHSYGVFQLTRNGLLPVAEWYPGMERFQPSRFVLAKEGFA